MDKEEEAGKKSKRSGGTTRRSQGRRAEAREEEKVKRKTDFIVGLVGPSARLYTFLLDDLGTHSHLH